VERNLLTFLLTLLKFSEDAQCGATRRRTRCCFVDLVPTPAVSDHAMNGAKGCPALQSCSRSGFLSDCSSISKCCPICQTDYNTLWRGGVTMGSDAGASSTWENLPKWEGPAFASILAVLLGLSFQKLSGIFDGALYWFIFTVFCGLYIDPLRYRSWRELFLFCALPAAWLSGYVGYSSSAGHSLGWVPS
jgi:hypothetical protein